MNQDTIKTITAFAKALRDVNRVPLLSGEEIVRIKRITGKDGIERELIFVKKLETQPPAPGEMNEGSTFHLHYGKTPRSLMALLRHGYGIDRGIITDGKTYRFDRR